jgi:hypothetical protein
MTRRAAAAQVNGTWIAQALEEGRDLFPRNNHHGQLQPSYVYDAVQCGGGGVQQQLSHMQRHLPHALSNAAALQVLCPLPCKALRLHPTPLHLTPPPPPSQRFPSFVPWLNSCAPRTA